MMYLLLIKSVNIRQTLVAGSVTSKQQSLELRPFSQVVIFAVDTKIRPILALSKNFFVRKVWSNFYCMGRTGQ